MLIASTAFSLIAAPVVIYADASAPGIDRPKMMKKKPRAKVKARARAQAKPQMQEARPMMEKPMQEVVQQAPTPEPVAAPEPVAQVAEAAPAAPAPVVKSGGSNWLLGVAAAAAVAAGIVLAADGQSSPS